MFYKNFVWLTLLPSLSLAQWSYPEGGFLQASLGWAVIAQTRVLGDQRDGFGWDISGGYRFNKYLASEIGLSFYPNTQFSDSAGNTVSGSNHFAGHLAARLTSPAFYGLTPYGMLGVAVVTEEKTSVIAENTFTRAALYFGAGLGYALTPRVTVFAQATGTTQAAHVVPAFYLATVGVAYQFHEINGF